MHTIIRLFLPVLSSLLIVASLSLQAEIRSAQQYNQALYDRLPESIQKAKTIVTVNDGTVPPYVLYNDGQTVTGATIDLFNAIGEILGVEIQYQTTNGISGVLMGVQSGRYDLGIGPIGDIVDRQASNDFVDYAISYATFAVQKGNPAHIQSIADTCGKRIAVTVGGSAESIFTRYSNEQCSKENKKPIEILIFKDQSAAMLAVKSGRADAFYAGLNTLSYFIANAKDDLELASTVRQDGIPIRYYAAVVAKDASLGSVLLAAIQQLFDNGTYAEIMKKWNLETSMLAEPGLNLAK